MKKFDSLASTSAADSPPEPGGSSRFYALAWRWHFYAGMYVVPFLFMLAVTGLVMVFFTGFHTRFGLTEHVTPQGTTLAVSQQTEAALAGRPMNILKEYIAPEAANAPSWFVVDNNGVSEAIAVDPYTAQVVTVIDKEDAVFAWAERIHGSLLLGDTGDRLIEIAAGLGIVMIVSGLYLWWPRGNRNWSDALIPALGAKGRRWWKSLHSSLGFWLSAVLLVFLLTGLSWTGIWGSKLVQPWNTFPATKWDDVPKSDMTHAQMNPAGLHEVPWGLEQTPVPASGSSAGVAGTLPNEAVDLESVVRLAGRLGFSGQYHVRMPKGEEGVYTLSTDTMSGDLADPTEDRTVHVDRYTGKVLAEARFADYSLVAKGMAVGIALHQGDLGLWNARLNLLICAGVAFLCVSGVVMWWKRRPAGSTTLVAPERPLQPALWKGGAIVMLTTSLLFPLSGAVLLTVLLLDWLLISRLPALKRVLS